MCEREREMGAMESWSSSSAMMKRVVMVMVVVVMMCSLGEVHAFEWADCLQAGECDEKLGCIHWVDVTSSPDPVVRNGSQQNVTKVGHWSGSEDVEALSAHFSQYYQVAGHWVPFLKINIDVCKQYNMCPLLANQDFVESKLHPPFSRYIYGSVSLLAPRH